jgi:hypothetical protein
MKAQWLTLRRLAIIFGAAALLGTVTGYLVEKGVWTFVEPIQTLIQAFYANFSTELLSIVVTIVVIDTIIERRAVAQQKADLILQMSSPDNAFAVEAARILKARGWGFEGDATLHGAQLRWASLQGVNIEGVSLQQANLWEVNLDRAFLVRANLQGADLRVVNLQGALMMGVNLRGALLDEANLQGARLDDITVYGPQGPETVKTSFDEDTTLPDGSHWTPLTDMRRFTNPDHPNFWRSDDPDSPAYRGNDDGDKGDAQ